MGNTLSQWIKKNSVLLFNTGSLVGTMLVTSGLGFAYWLVAARFFPTENVGLASSATSAMMVLSTLFVLGQGTVLITELPRNKGIAGSLISASLLLVGVTSFVGGAVFALCAPLLSPELRFLDANITSVLLFALGVCLAAVTVVLDQAVIGLLQGGLQLWRNTLFSILKLVLLVVISDYFARKSGISIYTTWTLGNIISLLPIFIFLIRKKKLALRYYKPKWGMMKQLGWASFQHHILNLIVIAPTQLLSLMVTVLLSARSEAWFYIALMMSNFVFSLSTSLTTVLHATNAAHYSMLKSKARLTVGLSFVASIVMGILIFGAPSILRFFGPDYANHSVESMRILVLAAIPLTIKNHYLAFCRIKDQVRQAIVPVTVGALLELGIAALGAKMGGLTGLSLGWVGATILESLIMMPVVWNTLMGKSGQSALDRYLDEIVSTETMLLPALNDFTPSGAIYITSTGLSTVLTELDTVRMSVVSLKKMRNMSDNIDKERSGEAPKRNQFLSSPGALREMSSPGELPRRNQFLSSPGELPRRNQFLSSPGSLREMSSPGSLQEEISSRYTANNTDSNANIGQLSFDHLSESDDDRNKQVAFPSLWSNANETQRPSLPGGSSFTWSAVDKPITKPRPLVPKQDTLFKPVSAEPQKDEPAKAVQKAPGGAEEYDTLTMPKPKVGRIEERETLVMVKSKVGE